MGIAGSPDIFQEKMSDLMQNLEYVRTYLDDVISISKSNFKDHIEKSEEVLRRLQNAGLNCNVEKYKFCAMETEYLGYVLTQEGIKPQAKRWLVFLHSNLLKM